MRGMVMVLLAVACWAALSVAAPQCKGEIRAMTDAEMQAASGGIYTGFCIMEGHMCTPDAPPVGNANCGAAPACAGYFWAATTMAADFDHYCSTIGANPTDKCSEGWTFCSAGTATSCVPVAIGAGWTCGRGPSTPVYGTLGVKSIAVGTRNCP